MEPGFFDFNYRNNSIYYRTNFGIEYANGKWKVSESKILTIWIGQIHTEKKLKKVIIISIIYGILMIIQISNMIWIKTA
jgi:hypothetical protein